MNSTTGTVLAGSVLVSTTSLLAAGLFWALANESGRRWATEQAEVQRQEMRAQITELCRRVGALQRLLEGVD